MAEMSISLKLTLNAINEFCQDLVREGFVSKINLEVDLDEINTNLENAQILHKFYNKIQNATQQTLKDDKQHIQIKADNKEIYRRISAFMAYKRMEVDELNVQEFCNRISINEENENSCARIDAVLVKRSGSKSHVKMSRVINQSGPQTAPETIEKTMEKCEKLKNSSAIEERISNMETHLKMNEKSNTKDVFERLKNLENRILYLEGITTDYFHSKVQKSPKSHKYQSIIDYKSGQQMSLDEIDARILSVKKSLKRKRENLCPSD